ncbi:MAG: dienelactone hydrolase family protein [Chloroherpetonaceae bacterium]|nr:dienelactone hydrolase family protein [Chloroherpetonaceae bacterium]
MHLRYLVMQLTGIGLWWLVSAQASIGLHAQSLPAPSPVAYLARPTAKTQAAVLVVHDNFGVDAWIRSLCDSLAQAGFLAAAVNLYRGRVPEDFMEAHELERALPEKDAQQRVVDAANYLRNVEKVRRIGLLGIAIGGSIALEVLACQGIEFQACVVNYAALPTADSLIKPITCPLMLHVGERDIGIDRASVAQFTSKMQGFQKSVELCSYPKAGFGFLRPTAEGFRPNDATLAWQRTVLFFKKHLF